MKRALRVGLGAVSFALCASYSGSAMAQVLPMLVETDVAGQAHFWWATDPVAAAGPVDDALFAAAAQSPTWISPVTVAPSGTISRIYRVAELPATNARNLAGLFGADWVCLGEAAWRAQPGVPWLALRGAAVELTGLLVSVDTGAEVGRFEVRFSGLGSTDAEAEAEAAGALVRYLDTQLAALTYQGGEIGDGQAGRVIVLGAGDASPFVAFRRSLREAIPGVDEVSEAWASEGRIALDVALSDGNSFDSLAAGLIALEGAPLGDVLLQRVTQEDGQIFVELGGTVAPDTP